MAKKPFHVRFLWNIFFLEKIFEFFSKIMTISSKGFFVWKSAQWKFLPKVFEKGFLKVQ